MALFGILRKKPEQQTVALIDVSADSIGGAYTYFLGSAAPAIAYARRLPIEARAGEAKEAAMLRALDTLGNALISEGAPALARAAGSGHVDTILVSLGAPWQETSLRTELVERASPFIFTRSLVSTVLERTRAVPADKRLGNESIIGTVLNGYETMQPYGKRAHRASILVLTSYVDQAAAEGISEILRRLYHTKNILHVARSSLRYQAMRAAFPHEPNALILDVTGGALVVTCIRNGLLVAVSEAPGTVDPATWVATLSGQLAEMAKRFPLPRMIFLLTPEEGGASWRTALESANLGPLWLSDNPPKLVSVLSSHLTGLVRVTSETAPNVSLILMALYAQRELSG